MKRIVGPSTARKYAALSRAGRDRVLAMVRGEGVSPRAAINAVLCEQLLEKERRKR